VQLLIYQDYS